MLYALFQLWVDGVKDILCTVSTMGGWCEGHFVHRFNCGWMV